MFRANSPCVPDVRARGWLIPGHDDFPFPGSPIIHAQLRKVRTTMTFFWIQFSSTTSCYLRSSRSSTNFEELLVAVSSLIESLVRSHPPLRHMARTWMDRRDIIEPNVLRTSARRSRINPRYYEVPVKLTILIISSKFLLKPPPRVTYHPVLPSFPNYDPWSASTKGTKQSLFVTFLTFLDSFWRRHKSQTLRRRLFGTPAVFDR